MTRSYATFPAVTCHEHSNVAVALVKLTNIWIILFPFFCICSRASHCQILEMSGSYFVSCWITEKQPALTKFLVVCMFVAVENWLRSATLSQGLLLLPIPFHAQVSESVGSQETYLGFPLLRQGCLQAGGPCLCLILVPWTSLVKLEGSCCFLLARSPCASR